MSGRKSSVEGIIWPAVPARPMAQLLAVTHQLDQSQWWSPDQLHAAQQGQLRLLLEHTLRTVPYYRDLYASQHLPTDPAALLERWTEMPILSRAAIQAAGDSLLSTDVPREHGSVQPIRTSGSTGRPIRVQRTGLTQFFWMAFTLREHFWHRRDVTGTRVAIRPDRNADSETGSSMPTWGPPEDQLFETGRAAILGSGADLSHQAQWLAKHDPTYLLTMPSNLEALARVCREQGVHLPRLREVRTYAETLKPGVREICAEVWNVPLTDMYSCQEAGYIALQCPEHEHYHIQSEGVLVEVLDEHDKACAAGEVGRLVLTTLHNFAMPLIRYENFDLVEAGSPCDCGRGLPVINRVLGRQRNLITLPDGSRHWPSFVSAIWADVAPIEQLQIVQKSLEQIELRMVIDRELTVREQEHIAKGLGASLGYPFEFSFRYYDEIPRGPGGKYEDFISEVAQPE